MIYMLQSQKFATNFLTSCIVYKFKFIFLISLYFLKVYICESSRLADIFYILTFYFLDPVSHFFYVSSQLCIKINLQDSWGNLWNIYHFFIGERKKINDEINFEVAKALRESISPVRCESLCFDRKLIVFDPIIWSEESIHPRAYQKVFREILLSLRAHSRKIDRRVHHSSISFFCPHDIAAWVSEMTLVEWYRFCVSQSRALEIFFAECSDDITSFLKWETEWFPSEYSSWFFPFTWRYKVEYMHKNIFRGLTYPALQG